MSQAALASSWNPPCWEGAGLAQPGLGKVPNMLVQACPPGPGGPPNTLAAWERQGPIPSGREARDREGGDRYTQGGAERLYTEKVNTEPRRGRRETSDLTVLITQNHFWWGGEVGVGKEQKLWKQEVHSSKATLSFLGCVTSAAKVPFKPQ